MRNITILVAFLFHVLVFGQSSGYIKLTGKITDNKTKDGIPYVSIQLKNTFLGTQSDQNGEYVLKIPKSTQPDTVLFAAIGYKKLEIPVLELQKKSNIKLIPYSIELKEVMIKDFASPGRIIDEAIKRIPQNYHTDTTINTFFCRNYSILNDSIYLFYESIVDMLRLGYGLFSSKHSVSLDDYKRTIETNYKAIRKHRLMVFDTNYVYNIVANQQQMQSLMSYTDNSAFIDHIELQNASYFLAKRIRKKHRYLPLKEFTDDNGDSFYQIEMLGGNSDTNTIQVKYTVIIDKKDLAIVDMFFIIENQNIKEKRKGYYYMNPYESSTFHKAFHRSKYEKRRGKYTLVYLFYEEDRSNVSHNKLKYTHATTHQHFKTYDLWYLVDYQKGDTSFLSNNDIQGHKSQLYSHVFNHSSYDDSFWEQYNTVPLEDSIKQLLYAKMESENPKTITDSSIFLPPSPSIALENSITDIKQDLKYPAIKPFRMGAMLGIGTSRFAFTSGPVTGKSSFGMEAGFNTTLHLYKRFWLRTDVVYEMFNGQYYGGTLRSHAVTIPAKLQFDLLTASFTNGARFYIALGGYYSYSFAGNQGSSNTTYSDTFNRNNYGWSWGIGFEIMENMIMEWNSYYGLSSSLLHRTNETDIRQRKNMITIGYIF